MRSRLLAATAAVALIAGGSAQAGIIDFGGDAAGPVAEGFAATGHPQLQFYSDLGAGLELLGTDPGQGLSMVVRNDTNGNFLKGVFNDGPHSTLQFDFGNDDPFFSNPGDRAVVTLYSGAALVGQVQTVFNRDDLLNQRVTFAGGSYDNFSIAFTDAAGNPFTGGGGAAVGLIEVVDNVAFDEPLVTPLSRFIDFEADTSGAKPQGFKSTSGPELSFFTDLGSGLELADLATEGDGRSMLVRNDTNGNFLKGVFSDGPHTFLSLDFGNDDRAFTNPGDRATLTLYLGAALVSQVMLVMNRDDLMNQTLTYLGGPFDNFSLAYVDAVGNPFTGGGGVAVGLIEVIDNVTFDRTSVPEPATWAMMILGLGCVGAMVRRRRNGRRITSRDACSA